MGTRGIAEKPIYVRPLTEGSIAQSDVYPGVAQPFDSFCVTTKPPLNANFLSTRQARERVAQINSDAKRISGHWGRNSGKYLNWTLIGLPLGVKAAKKTARRVSEEMSGQLAELKNIHGALTQIPRNERSAAQKSLLKKSEIALRKFDPTMRTHLMQGLKGAAVVGTVVGVLGLEAAMIALVIAAASQGGDAGDYTPGFVMLGFYGDGFANPIYVPSFEGSNLNPKAVKPKDGDDGPFNGVYQATMPYPS